jgi:glycosyltransferase involved in cell wall biosynthesis
LTVRYLAACDRFFGDAPGGAYRIAWELAKLVRKSGGEATLLCGSLESDPPEGCALIDGVEVLRYRLPGKGLPGPLRWWAHLGSAQKVLQRYLPGRRFDIIHGHTPAPALAATHRFPNVRTIYTVHSPVVLEQRINWTGSGAGGLKRIFGEPILRSAEFELLSHSATIQVLSEYTRGLLVEMHGTAISNKVVRIPWWRAARDRRWLSKAEARAQLGWPPDRAVLFSLRRLVARMGMDVLVDAVAKLGHEIDFFVAVGGDGPERPRLQELARQRGVERRIKFLGRMSDEDVARAYQAADAFVLPTSALECFGMIILEAFGFGCPVLASRTGAIQEIVSGIAPQALFNPADSEDLAAILKRFFEGALLMPSPEALERYIEAEYGFERISREYLALLGMGQPTNVGPRSH